MVRDLSRFSNCCFDLFIVGGGIVGAGIAWDAAQRGLSCALAEQGDFAGGTSSKTTKLIHGGLRYLEQLDLKLVRESLRERQTLLKIAPHLVKPLPFLIPVIGRRPRPAWQLRAGLFLYDLLAGQGVIAPHRFLKGAFLYHDAQMDDARMVIGVLLAACGAGAVAANHLQVIRWIEEQGRLTGAELEDRLSGRRHTVRARSFVNAAGPWVDAVRRLADPAVKPVVRPSKGIHLVYPDIGLKEAVLLSAEDRRIFFLIPWNGLTLIGTTDTDYSGDPGEARAEPDDVEYLLRETNRLLPHLALRRDRVITTFAGVRPLAAEESKRPSAVSRRHRLHRDPNGLISVVGGKFTTFRKMAEEVVDLICAEFPGRRFAPCRTGNSPLAPLTAGRSEEIKRFIQADPALAEPLCPHHPFTHADVIHAAREEMAMTLSDLLFRRFGISWSACQGLDALEPAARRMAEALGWSDSERLRQIALFRDEVAALKCPLA